MDQALPTPQERTGRPARGHDGLRLALYLAALISLGAAGSALHPRLAAAGGAGPEVDGAGWEGRRLIAQVLWAKSHGVMHAGIEERQARAGEAESRSGEFHGHGEAGVANAKGGHHEGDGHAHGEEGHGEEGHVYVIPPAREDFRGLIGHLERAVKPYLAPSGQPYTKDSSQTVPFYRLMTWADPHFVQGYVIGSYFLRTGKGGTVDSGLEFLREGARHNPGSFEIQCELGHLYLVPKNDVPRAIHHLEAALRLVPRRELSEVEKDAHLDTYRWLALAYVRSGRAQDALRLAQNGCRLWDDDITLRQVLQHQGRDWTTRK